MGRVHPDTYVFNDLKKLKALKSIPQMKTVDIYHDGRLVFGFEVTYVHETRSSKPFQVGHHIGSHVNGDV